jgi:hypothetical protein
MVALAGRLALAAEDLGREQEPATVDPRLLQMLAERDHGPVHHPDPSALPPGRPVGAGSMSTAGAPTASSQASAPSAKMWSAVTSRNSA